MDTIALPISFRFGGFEKYADGTDEYYAHILAMTMQIEPGELPITTNYGCYSPLFDNSAIANFAVTAAQFIPEIDIIDVEGTDNGFGDIQIEVSFVQGDQISYIQGLEE